MNTDIVKHAQALPVTSMADMASVGQLLAQTGMFGTNNPAEGFVIAAMCHQSGMTFIEYMQTYHLIKGKVSKRADAIQADFQRAGGKVKILQRDAEGAVVELEKDGTKHTSRCLWLECKNEPFVYKGGLADLKKPEAQREIKENYATPRKRLQLLWARAISDGVRAVYPAAVQGVYTPEETEDFEPETRGPSEPVKIDASDVSLRVKVLTPDAQPKHTEAPATAAVTTQAPAAATCSASTSEPTPFEMIDAKPAAAIDATVCPIPGPMFGKRWADMPAAHLEAALNLSNPELLGAHRECIKEEIAKKGASK